MTQRLKAGEEPLQKLTFHSRLQQVYGDPAGRRQGIKTLISLFFPTYLPPTQAFCWLTSAKPDNKRWVDGGHRAGVKVASGSERTEDYFQPMTLCIFEENTKIFIWENVGTTLPIKQLKNRHFLLLRIPRIRLLQSGVRAKSRTILELILAA